MPWQDDWRFCEKCYAMFYDGFADKGRCAFGAGHVSQGLMFALPYGLTTTGTVQENWRYCEKCHVMFYDGFADKGSCPAGGGHAAQGIVFSLQHSIPSSASAQDNWRYCQKCHAMFYDGFANNGICSAGGGHVAQGLNFTLPHTGAGMASPYEIQIVRLNALKTNWNAYHISDPAPARYCKIKDDLYKVRNADWNGNPPISSWPAYLIDADDGIMAAVEHYFLSRCWVGNGIYPAWQVRAMTNIYDQGKAIGVTPKHNPNKPTTPLSKLQMHAQREGVQDGEKDLTTSGASAPVITSPPKYY
jgi:hypothetical protein